MRGLVRGALLVGWIGLAMHLVLPQIPGIERSLRLVIGTSQARGGARHVELAGRWGFPDSGCPACTVGHFRERQEPYLLAFLEVELASLLVALRSLVLLIRRVRDARRAGGEDGRVA